VDDLYDIIRKRTEHVSKPTVYRTIPLLLEAGLIKKSFTSNDKDYYEHILGHQEHLHLICTQCGKVIELNCADLELKLDEYAAKEQFQISEKSVIIKGICSDCQKN
jgi:Fur family ferric uptake transcriptional regulator